MHACNPTTDMEQEIRDALSLSEPAIAAASLLHIVKQKPTARTVAWLAELYEELAIENPIRTDALTQSLVLLRDSPDIPTIVKHDSKEGPYQESFRVVQSLFMYDVLSGALVGVNSDSAIEPTNSFLVGSIMSAAATKQRLCCSAAQIGAVALGIQFPGTEYQKYCDPEALEASSLGACLQLLIAGSVFCNSGQLGRNKEQLLPSLKSLLKSETIKDPNGKRLLQVRTAGILFLSALFLIIP
jgi:hypothetical protein